MGLPPKGGFCDNPGLPWVAIPKGTTATELARWSEHCDCASERCEAGVASLDGRERQQEYGDFRRQNPWFPHSRVGRSCLLATSPTYVLASHLAGPISTNQTVGV